MDQVVSNSFGTDIMHKTGIFVVLCMLVCLLIFETMDLADDTYDLLYNQVFNGASGTLMIMLQVLLIPYLDDFTKEVPGKRVIEFAKESWRPDSLAERIWIITFVVVITWTSIAQAIVGVGRGQTLAPLIRLILWLVFALVGIVVFILWRWWRVHYRTKVLARNKRIVALLLCLVYQCVLSANGIVCQRNYQDAGCRGLVSIIVLMSFLPLILCFFYIVAGVPSDSFPEVNYCLDKCTGAERPISNPRNYDVYLTMIVGIIIAIIYLCDGLEIIPGFSGSAPPTFGTLLVILQFRLTTSDSLALDATGNTNRNKSSSYSEALFEDQSKASGGFFCLTAAEKLWLGYYVMFGSVIAIVATALDFEVSISPTIAAVLAELAVLALAPAFLYFWRSYKKVVLATETRSRWSAFGWAILIVQLVHGVPLYLCESQNGQNPCLPLLILAEAVNFPLFLGYILAILVFYNAYKSRAERFIPVYKASWFCHCLCINLVIVIVLTFAGTVAFTYFYVADANFNYCPSTESRASVFSSLEDQDPVAYALIMSAGNSHSDSNRTAYLKQLSSHLGNSGMGDSTLAADVNTVLEVAELWSDGEGYVSPVEDTLGESGYLVGWFVFEVWPSFISNVFGRPVFPSQVSSTESALHPIWAMYRGRMMIHNGVENGFLTEFYYPRGIDFITCASQVFTENMVLRQYLGETMEWPDSEVFAGDADESEAPEWAILQRSLLERLVDVIKFWIRNRQISDGQFGGGWNDDVEIWRWGSPILLGFETGVALEYQLAQRKLSEGVFNLSRLANGYTAYITDVEHTAEDTSDTIIPMMLLYPEEQVWKDRALRLAELMDELWTDQNNDDLLSFKSNYFSSEGTDSRPEVACDIPKNVRSITPALVLWQQDPASYPELTTLFRDWMDTWVAATANSDCGKPAGVVPASIHFPSGRTGGAATADWWQPGCKVACLSFNDNEEFCADDIDAFEWPSSVQDIAQTLILTAYATGDDCKYLYPVRSMANIRREYLAGNLEKTKKIGTIGWVGRKLRSSFVEALAKSKLLTNNSEFDDLIPDANGYARFYMTGDLDELVKGLRRSIIAYSVNYEQYTSEVRFTDRVRKFHDNFWNKYFDSVAPVKMSNPLWPPLNISLSDLTEIPQVDELALYMMLTGDLGSPMLMPLPGVRWQTEPQEFAALVSENGFNRFSAQLFHFGSSTRNMGAKLLRLAAGVYDWTLNCSSSSFTGNFTNDNVTTFTFQLPSRTLCTLDIDARDPVVVTPPAQSCSVNDEQYRTTSKQCQVEVPERLPVLLITVPQAMQYALLVLLALVLLTMLWTLVAFKLRII